MSACLKHEFAAPRVGELRALLENFLENIIATVGATAGVVRLLSPDGNTLEVISSAGLTRDLQKEAKNFVELNCEVNDIAALNRSVHASDVSACGSRQNCSYSDCHFQSLIAAPLDQSGSGSTPLGVLTLFFDRSSTIVREATNTVAAFASMISATIEHTRTNREMHRQERLAARLEIANDIHDSLAQTLTYARMRVSLLLETIRSGNEVMATKYAQDVDEALEIGQKSTRELIADFRCELNSGGLLSALNDLTCQFRERNDIELEYHNRLVELELPLEHEIHIYHIVQEALNNIARHSGATHARLFVHADFGYYIFTIEDNGSGAHTFAPIEGHYGMMIMKERAHRIGGNIKINSSTGMGTQVQLFFAEPK